MLDTNILIALFADNATVKSQIAQAEQSFTRLKYKPQREHKKAMTLQEVEQAIMQLPPQDVAALRDWLNELDAENWDRQIETDIAAGRLDTLADRALQQFQDGQCRDL
ncbi:MAG: hypothetical protein ACFB9N_12570 [Geitlerinemataceae cyanobacterium]